MAFSFEAIVFGVMAGAAVILALAMLSVKSPIHSALCLVGVMACLAVLYIMQGAYLLGVVQVVVYAGAVMVLFLFVLMFFYSPRAADKFDRFSPSTRTAAAVILALALFGMLLFSFGNFSMTREPGLESVGAGTPRVESPDRLIAQADRAEFEKRNPELIGEMLFSKYLLPFELTSLLLLAAMVGAVVLAKRSPGGESDAAQGGRK